MFVLALGLGALFWVTLQNLVNAHWSIVLRRVGELLAAQAPLLAVLAYRSWCLCSPATRDLRWANTEELAKPEVQHMVHKKAAYLTVVSSWCASSSTSATGRCCRGSS